MAERTIVIDDLETAWKAWLAADATSRASPPALMDYLLRLGEDTEVGDEPSWTLIQVDLYWRVQAGEAPPLTSRYLGLPGFVWTDERRSQLTALESQWRSSVTVSETSPGSATVPGYEILSVLGRGGMGVVYKARQASLNRVVALKMLHEGDLADPETRARFKKEAEAVAQLQHPNIVQIHEIGEHLGRPFFALEFVSGGSLAERLGGVPLSPQETARIVEILSRAVHAAHQLGIIHRDIKPQNILMAADGTPKIADFGLAKKLEEEASAGGEGMPGQTQTGAILGTPSYMAPEQVQSKGEKLGPAADVHALGAVLYVCLTGQPPFRAATVMETLQKVLDVEPVPPSRFRKNIPADLQAICLRCLEKRPSSRYASAAALADDLARFLAGRPTLARPIGPAARAARWVRQRPVVAGLSFTILLLALSSFAAFAGWWIDASENKIREEADTALQQKKEDARREKDDALQKARQAQEKEREKSRLVQATLEKEDTLADKLLIPLGYDSQVLAPAELDALRNLAAGPSARVRFRFIEKGLERPDIAVRLGRRSELAIQAAVGLDRTRRQQVMDLVRLHLRDGKTKHEVREACVLLGVALGMNDEAFCRDGTTITLEALERETEPYARARFGRAFDALAKGTPSDEKARSAATGHLVDAMLRSKDLKALIELDRALSVLSAQISAPRADELIDRLLGAMPKTADPTSLAGLGRGVATLSVRLGPERRSIVASTAMSRLLTMATMVAADKTPAANSLTELGGVMALLAEGLSPEEALNQAKDLMNLINIPTTNPMVLAGIGRALGAVAERVEAEQRGGLQVVAPIALLDAMHKTTNAKAQVELARAITELSSRLPPSMVGNLIANYVAPINTMTDPIALAEIGRAINVLADGLEDEPRAQAVGTANPMLLACSFQPTNPHKAAALGRVVESLSPRLLPQISAVFCEQLLEVVPFTKDVHVLAAQVQAAGALARQADRELLKRKVDAGVAGRLLDAMSHTSDPYLLTNLGQAVVALSSPRLGAAPDEWVLAAAAEKLQAGMRRTNEPCAVAGLGQVLVRLVERLKSKQRELIAVAASSTVHDAMVGTAEPRDLLELVQALNVLAKTLNQEQRQRIAGIAIGRLLDTGAGRPDGFVPSTSRQLEREMEALADQVVTGNLIALLKSPTCVHEGRRILLKALGRRLSRYPPAETSSAFAVATLQPCPLASAAVVSYFESLYPGCRVPFVNLWEAIDFLGVHYPEFDLPASMLTEER